MNEQGEESKTSHASEIVQMRYPWRATMIAMDVEEE